MCIITNELTRAHFLEMERLERRFYSADYITPAKEAYQYYIEHPRSTFAALDGASIAGFINLFPVKESVFSALMRGEYNDCALTSDDIAYEDGVSALNMFLSSVAVSEEYRVRGTAYALLRAAVTSYQDVQRRVSHIAADCVTREGCRFVEGLGFRFVTESDHASRVYSMPYSSFFENALEKTRRSVEFDRPHLK